MRLQDLRVLITVVEAGSMGKAARRLNTSQPAISRSISDLEHTFGVRLLDRNRQGVVATKYGRALIECGVVVFDDLRQGIRNIEFLADPNAGEIVIGGNESIIGGLLPAAIARLRRNYPGITVHVTPVTAVAQQHRELRERKVDLILGRIAKSVDDDLKAEVLFLERTVVVAGAQNKLTRRRKIELAELAEEPWALPPPDSVIGVLVADAFRASGVAIARRGVATGSIHMLGALLASGPFVATFPGSMLRLAPNLPPLKVLPVELSIPPWPVGILTLKDRMMAPAAKLFIDCVREVAKPLT
jgi:DNA-binding transcriptional LysR family regulator